MDSLAQAISSGGGGGDWGSITGSLSNQTDLQNALDLKANDNEVVKKTDYTPAHSILVQQSGTGSPSSLQVSNNTIIGRNSGGGSQISDLSATDVKSILSLSNVDNTSDVNKPISSATQTALDGKVDNSQVLTDVPSGAVFTDTIYDDTAIQAEVDLNTAKNTYPSADSAKVAHLSVTQAVDLDQMESDITINNAKISYTDSAAVALNTAKVTNATHTGEVTGSGTLTIDPTAISGKSTATLDGTEEVLVNDGGTLKKATTQDIADLGGGGGGTYPQVLYKSSQTMMTSGSTYIFTHNLGITQADLVSGKYQISVAIEETSTRSRMYGYGTGTGSGKYYINDWSSSTSVTSVPFVYWQANTVAMRANQTDPTIVTVIQIFE